MRYRKWMALLGCLWLGSSLCIALPVAAADCGSGLVCLDQGWNEDQRNWWYSTSQGSRLLPLDWMLALERADAAAAPEEKFLSPQNVQRLGYLPGPQPGNGLPLGFELCQFIHIRVEFGKVSAE